MAMGRKRKASELESEAEGGGSDDETDYVYPPEIQGKLDRMEADFLSLFPEVGSPLNGSWGELCIRDFGRELELDYAQFTATVYGFKLLQWRAGASASNEEEAAQNGILQWFLTLDKLAGWPTHSVFTNSAGERVAAKDATAEEVEEHLVPKRIQQILDRSAELESKDLGEQLRQVHVASNALGAWACQQEILR